MDTALIVAINHRKKDIIELLLRVDNIKIDEKGIERTSAIRAK